MLAPSGRQRFLYLAFGVAPPAATHEWVERDIATGAFLVRRALQLVVGLVLGFWISVTLLGGSLWMVFGGFLGGLIVAFFQSTVLAGYVRRRALGYYEKKWDRKRLGN